MAEPTATPLPRLPRWLCHKMVDADQIREIIHVDGTVTLKLAEGAVIVASKVWDKRHMPEVGGYLVRYDDGYQSYSPKDAFEEGYSRVPPI